MNFKITDNEENNRIDVQINFDVDTWDELALIMEKLDSYFGF